MNPTQQQQQQPPPQVSTVSSRLPPGVENAVVTYSHRGRPRVMLTLDPGARRKLMVFSIILLVLGPLILVFNSVCLAMRRSYLAFGYATGVLYIVTGCLGVWGSKSNNPSAIRGALALSIQCTIWSMILAVTAIIIAAVVVHNRTVVTIVLEALLALISIIGGTLCLAVSVFYCKATCRARYAVPGGACAMCAPHCGQQVIVCGQQQQLPGQPVGPPAYSTVNPAASQQRQLQDPSSSAPPEELAPPSYDNIAADYRDKV